MVEDVQVGHVTEAMTEGTGISQCSAQAFSTPGARSTADAQLRYEPRGTKPLMLRGSAGGGA